MAALPYMQFYVADYLADTAHLTLEEHGAYLMLIMNYWQSGKPFPDDDKRLQRVCRADAEQWQRIRPALEEFFTIEDDLWIHGRIEQDLEKVLSKSETARKAAKSRKKSTDDKRTQSERKANDEQTHSHTDTDTDTDTEEKKDGPPASSSPGKPTTGACPHQQIIDLYHEILPTLRGVKIWTDKREKHLQARWREDPNRQNLDWWRDYFRIVAASNFLMGQNDRGFTPDLEWLVNQANMTKVLEGKYHARASPQGAAPSATFNQNKANIQAWLDMKKQQREREVSDCD